MLKEQILQLQKYSGVAGVLVLWAGVIVSMKNANLGIIDQRPLSYLGVDSRSSVIFSISLLVSAFCFINFAYYVSRKFQTKNRFLVYFLIGQVGQVIAAISPYGHQSNLKLIHTVAAFILAFSLPLLIWQFTVSQSGSRYRKLYKRLLVFELCAFLIGIGLFVFTRGIAPLGEALPAIGFHAWIIAVTYIGKREDN